MMATGIRALELVLNESANASTVLTSDVVAVGIVVLIGSLVASRAQQNAELTKTRSREAVADERRRIARELHDVVAHHISVMKVMTSAARANLQIDPQVSAEALMSVEKTAGEALSEMRRLLGVLRADGDEQAPTTPAPGVDDLEKLVEQAGRTGLPATLEVSGSRHRLPTGMHLAVYRVVQEALTNARKHAGAGARAVVRLRYETEAVVVDVSDDGVGPPIGLSASGYGLVGMAERVALYGGTLETGRAEDGGFRITARIPSHDRVEVAS